MNTLDYSFWFAWIPQPCLLGHCLPSSILIQKWFSHKNRTRHEWAARNKNFPIRHVFLEYGGYKSIVSKQASNTFNRNHAPASMLIKLRIFITMCITEWVWVYCDFFKPYGKFFTIHNNFQSKCDSTENEIRRDAFIQICFEQWDHQMFPYEHWPGSTIISILWHA